MAGKGLFNIKHPGQLHRDLGIPIGQTIPIGKIQAAAKRSDAVGRRARAALAMIAVTKKHHKKKK